MFDVAGTQNISNKAYNIITLTRTDQLDKTNPEYDKLQEDCAKSGYDLKELDAVFLLYKNKRKRHRTCWIKVWTNYKDLCWNKKKAYWNA